MDRKVSGPIDLTPIELAVRRLIMSMYAARSRERAAYARNIVMIYEMLAGFRHG